jgi:toxin CcdB
MARFDVYPNPDKSERTVIPYLLDVQSDHILGMNKRVVVPLWDSEQFEQPLDTITPLFEVAGQSVLMDTASLGAVPLRVLAHPVANLLAQQQPIQNALDALFGAY